MANRYEWTVGLVDEVSKPAKQAEQSTKGLEGSLDKLDNKKVTPEVKVETKVDPKAAEARLNASLTALAAKVPVKITWQNFGESSLIAEKVKNSFTQAAQAIQTRFTSTGASLSASLSKALSATGLTGPLNSAARAADSLKNGFMRVANEAAFIGKAAGSALSPIGGYVRSAVSPLGSIGTQGANLLVNGMRSGLGALRGAVGSAVSGVGTMVKSAIMNPLQTAFYAVNLFSGTLSGLAGKFPAIAAPAQKLNDIVARFSTDVFSKIDIKPLLTIIDNFTKFFTTASPELNRFKSMLQSIVNTAMLLIKPFTGMGTVKGIFSGITAAIDTLHIGFLRVVAVAIRLGRGIVEGFGPGNGIVKTFKESLATLAPLFGGLMSAVQPLGRFIGAVLAVAVNNVGLSLGILGRLVNGVVAGLKPFAAQIQESWAKLTKAGDATKTFSAIASVLGAVASRVGTIIGAILGPAINVVIKVINVAVLAVQALGKWLESLGVDWEAVGQSASDFATLITDTIGSALKWIGDQVDWLSSKLEAFLGKTTTTAKSAQDAIKKVEAPTTTVKVEKATVKQQAVVPQAVSQPVQKPATQQAAQPPVDMAKTNSALTAQNNTQKGILQSGTQTNALLTQMLEQNRQMLELMARQGGGTAATV